MQESLTPQPPRSTERSAFAQSFELAIQAACGMLAEILPQLGDEPEGPCSPIFHDAIDILETFTGLAKSVTHRAEHQRQLAELEKYRAAQQGKDVKQFVADEVPPPEIN